MPAFIQALIESNIWLRKLRQEYGEVAPDRQTAFAVALKIEDTAGEKHFQKVMGSPSDSKTVKILQKLCEDDINHYVRIEKYMTDAGETLETPVFKTKKILLVMDDESVAKLLTTILATEGEVDVARNGLEGLNRLKENSFDLIVSAVDIPIIKGLQFFMEAKKLTPDLAKKFLFFTSPPSPEQLSFFRDQHVRYLVKPSTIAEIRQTVLEMFP